MKIAQTRAPAVVRDVVCEDMAGSSVIGRGISDPEKCSAIKHVRRQYIADCPSEQYVYAQQYMGREVTQCSG